MEVRMWLVLLMIFMVSVKGDGELDENFYNSSCSNLETIVKQAVSAKLNQTRTTSPATLRLFFHDCFVTGCDASVMIELPNGGAEKDAPDNLSLAGDGFDTVIKAKQAVEAQCPGIVSCADILALAARDVVVMAGGPSFRVELGRRDGLISKASHVAGNLPEPEFNLTQLNALFAKNSLTQLDMIALSGAHTIGFSNCNRVSNRLYSFSPSSPLDPSLNPEYAQQLMISCPPNAATQNFVTLDPVTPRRFDNVYYQNLVSGKGLFSADQVLFSDSASKQTVIDFANRPDDFNTAFVNAMRKLGRTRVQTGHQGEIRRDCTTFNS